MGVKHCWFKQVSAKHNRLFIVSSLLCNDGGERQRGVRLLVLSGKDFGIRIVLVHLYR